MNRKYTCPNILLRFDQKIAKVIAMAKDRSSQELKSFEEIDSIDVDLFSENELLDVSKRHFIAKSSL